jgi:hypothetical protein
MGDQNRKEIDAHTRDARGGDERDSQGDGVADAAADQAAESRKGAKQHFAQPSTNREAVPGGIEGSIMEGEETDDASGTIGGGKTADRAQGNARRVDDL